MTEHKEKSFTDFVSLFTDIIERFQSGGMGDGQNMILEIIGMIFGIDNMEKRVKDSPNENPLQDAKPENFDRETAEKVANGPLNGNTDALARISNDEIILQPPVALDGAQTHEGHTHDHGDEGHDHEDTYRVSSTYGVRTLENTTKNHAGIDVATPIGTPLETQGNAEVAYAGHSDGYGNIVILHHGNGVFTLDAHLDHIDVQTGDILPAGTQYATTGNTGHGTGAHLHTEILLLEDDGKAYSINPKTVWDDALDLSIQDNRDRLIAEAKDAAGEHYKVSAAFDARVEDSYADKVIAFKENSDALSVQIPLPAQDQTLVADNTPTTPQTHS